MQFPVPCAPSSGHQGHAGKRPDPTIFRFVRELTARMSTLQFRQELETSSREEQIQTIYTLVGYESRLFLAWLRYVLKPSNIIAVMNWDWPDVALNALLTW